MPIELFTLAKSKEQPTDALPNFVQAYTAHKRVATLVKESHSGKLISDWEKAISGATQKPEQVDIAPAVSAYMAVKDEEELVRMSRHLRTPVDRLHRKSSAQQRI